MGKEATNYAAILAGMPQPYLILDPAWRSSPQATAILPSRQEPGTTFCRLGQAFEFDVHTCSDLFRSLIDKNRPTVLSKQEEFRLMFVVIEPHLDNNVHIDPARYRAIGQLHEHTILQRWRPRRSKKLRAGSKQV